MLVRPDPDPTDIKSESDRKNVKKLLTNPLNDYPVGAAAIKLAALDPTIVRADRVRTQGRVSFGRQNAYTDGVAVYLGPSLVVADPESWDLEDRHGNNATQWGNVEWDDPDAVGEVLAYVIWTIYADDQEGDPLSALDPAVQLLCHAAADRGDEVQVRRGVRAEGRVSFDAREGEEGVALFVPSLKMGRRQGGLAPAEAHIQTAYGKAPLSPIEARRLKRTMTSDPEKMPDPPEHR